MYNLEKVRRFDSALGKQDYCFRLCCFLPFLNWVNWIRRKSSTRLLPGQLKKGAFFGKIKGFNKYCARSATRAKMADNNTNANSGAAGQADSNVPVWLQKVQQAQNVQPAGQVSQEPPAAIPEGPLKKAIALKDHEENASHDEQGNVVLPNVVTGPEDAEAKAEERKLAGLVFEGEEGTMVAAPPPKEPVPIEQSAAVAQSPDWLKDLSQSQVPKADAIEPAAVEQPKAPLSEKANEETAKVQLEKNIKTKGNLIEDLKKGLSGAVKTSREEIEKGKRAGASESVITLENYEAAKAALNLSPEAAQPTAAAKDLTREKINLQERQQLLDSENIFQEGMATVRDLIAPSSLEINYDHLRVEGMFARSFIVYSYPRYLDTNWMSPLVNFDATMDITQFVYPIDSARIMRILSKKVTQMQSAMNINAEKGLIRDPALETAYEDAEQLRTEIQRGQEKFFQLAMYITVYADELKKIDRISKQLESILGSKLILTKRADLRMEHGFNSTSPMCLDELEIFRNMNTGPLSTTFPFSSSDLTSSEGILYGLNRHNDSLVIFDRFSLPNANSVVFAMSGAGKSYAVKLEILRYLMLGVDIIVIDPENEYEELAKTVGGTYLRVSLTSDRRINPFDLPAPLKDEELQPGDLLRSNIINLHGLLKIMLNGLSPVEEGLIDKALNDVYALKGITMDMIDPSNLPVPTMEDLHALLSNMQGAGDLAQRLEKFTKGTYSGIFNKLTNVDMASGLMVFSIRDLEDSLRPIAMYIILNFIWNRIRSQLKRRLMIVDEAWTMMQHEDSAKFLFGLVKRARKYYLGITTITQDVEDFIKSPYGKPIVTNSSMQLLLKQAPVSVNILQKVFNLTEGEKYMLLNSGVGQGLFFAGLKHVAIQVIASYTEDKIITTNPEEILRGLSTQTTENYE